MLGPVLIAIFFLVIAPLVWGLRISLTDTRMIGLGFKTGLTFENYRSVLSDPDTWNAIWVTIVFSGGTVVGSVVLGMAAALVRKPGGGPYGNGAVVGGVVGGRRRAAMERQNHLAGGKAGRHRGRGRARRRAPPPSPRHCSRAADEAHACLIGEGSALMVLVTGATGFSSEADIEASNFAGALNVLGAAADAGCAPIVHVSSTAALFRAIRS